YLEVVEGAVDVRDLGAAAGAEHAAADHRAAAGRRAPRAGEMDARIAGVVELRRHEVLALGQRRVHAPAVPVTAGVDRDGLGEAEQPVADVEEVAAEVEQAAAPGLRAIVVPRCVRAVGVVEAELGGDQRADLAFTDPAAQLRYSGEVAVGPVHAESEVAAARKPDEPFRGR